MASVQARTRPTKPRAERNDNLQKWTASRCNRLLRQISSRVSQLRQLVAEAAETNRPPKRPAAESNEEQPEQKRVRRTYAGRRKKADPLSERDINISTPPRIMRALGTMRPQIVSSPAGLCCPTPIRRPAFNDKKTASIDAKKDQPKSSGTRIKARNPVIGNARLMQLSDGVPSDHLKIYQAILGWLEKLIQVTEERNQESGCKSLLDMCLRKVPDCLDEIDAWDHKEAESAGHKSIWKSEDAAATIYGQLEAFGSSEEGWEPFKHLVRSHAIQILSRAAAEGIFTPEFVAIMAKSCARMRCTEEAERLLTACRGMADSDHQQGQGEATLSSAHQTCNRALLEICAGDGPLPSFLPVVGNAISSQQLLMEDILPKHISTLWKASLAAVDETQAIYQGTRLLVPALAALASGDSNGPWANQEGKERMLTSLAAAIAAAARTAQSQRDRRRHIFILEAAISEVRTKRGRSLKAQHCGLFLLTMARQLAMEGDQSMFAELRAQGVMDLDNLITRSNVEALYHQTVALTCSVAHACSRSVAKPSHEILDHLRISLHELPLPRWFIEGLRSEGAFVLAQKTKDLRDLAFAENLSVARDSGPSQTTMTTMFSGWRWEAGISEWVLPSPCGKAVMRGMLPTTKQCQIDNVGLERQGKPRMRKGFMRKGLQANPQPRDIVMPHATSQREESGTLQSKLHDTPEGAPRRKKLHVVQSCEALSPQRQGHVWYARVENKLCRDQISRIDGNDDERCGKIAGTSDPAEHGGDRPGDEPRRSSGIRATAVLKARGRNGDLADDGVQGLGIMRMAAMATATSKVERRKSTTAVPCMQRRLGSGSSRWQRRRTTVSLSSLAMWPGSDDWDELL